MIEPDRKGSQLPPQEAAATLGGCLVLLVLLVLLGKCVFSSDGTKEAAPAPPKLIAPRSEQSGAVDQSKGANILEQAFLEAFPAAPLKTKAARQKAAQAADYIGLAINSAGHACARVVEAKKASWGQYGVGCRTRASGGYATYLVDVRSGSIDEI